MCSSMIYNLNEALFISTFGKSVRWRICCRKWPEIDKIRQMFWGENRSFGRSMNEFLYIKPWSIWALGQKCTLALTALWIVDV